MGGDACGGSANGQGKGRASRDEAMPMQQSLSPPAPDVQWEDADYLPLDNSMF
jgi:hypothetical protein